LSCRARPASTRYIRRTSPFRPLPGIPGTLVNFDKNNFYPRFGFAYKPFANDKTVIRGGYGIYGNMIYGSLAKTMVGGPFAGSQSFTNSLTSGVPLFSFPNPFLSTGACHHS
jgi:hypothetical protein